MRRTAYDFAVTAVRDYKLALAEEAINRYDLDGLDWDFCRVPVFFQPDEVGRGTALITDLVRRLKTAFGRKSERVGRPLLFSARVLRDLSMRSLPLGWTCAPGSRRD